MRRVLRGGFAIVVLVAGLVVWAVVATTDAWAQTPATAEIDVVYQFDPPFPLLGERVRLTVTVTHPAELLVVASRPLQSTSTFDVVEAVPPQSAPLEARVVTEFAYVLAPFDLGPIDLGVLGLTTLDEGGARAFMEVPLPPLGVQATIAGPSDLELRPLPPQLEVGGAPAAWQRPAAFAAAFALLAILAAFFLGRTWRRSATAEVLVPLPPATAEDRARRRLDAIGRARFVPAGEMEAYYGELSLAVRDYLEERFGFRATALTTRELERRARDTSIDRWQARLVGGLLQRCDAAVYAGVWPDPASADHDLTLAYEIVELSRPRRIEEAAEAVPA